MNRDEEFTSFVANRSRDLLLLARVLCGDRSGAEDLVQEALYGAYTHWTAAREQPLAYTRRSVANRHTDQLRRGRVLRIGNLSDTGPDLRKQDADPSTRVVLESELRKLPRREREVVVLRFVCDLPERDVAELLGFSLGTVKSSASRGVARLREALATEEGLLR